MFNLFNLTLKLNGFPIKKAQADFKEILNIADEDYAEYIEDKKEAADFVIDNSRGLEDLEKNFSKLIKKIC